MLMNRLGLLLMQNRTYKIIAVQILLFIMLGGSGCSMSKSEIDIEAQVIYNMGGPQPVARTTFYLLNADPFNLPEDKSSDDDLMKVTSKAIVAALKTLVSDKSKGDKMGKDWWSGAFQSALKTWQPYIVKSVDTDFKGQATFDNIPSGTYWILGLAETRGGVALWSTKVEVGTWSTTRVLLDQNNAAYAK
jgi:hypothetical protein